MAAYIIVQIKMTKEGGWPEYRAQAAPLIAKFGGRYAVRGGDLEVLEGPPHDGRRMVVLEFPSMEAIRSFWHSPEYAKVKQLRLGSGEMSAWAVPGYAG
jgi:uncharacterized protein (DUF1330 family)